MNQTIFSLAALMILAGVALSFNANTMHSHKVQTDLQLEIMAQGVATRILDLLSFSAFDERVTPSQLASLGRPAVGDYSEFAKQDEFGSNTACSFSNPSLNTSTCDDLDDFSMTSTKWVQTHFDPTDTLTIPFDVNVQVVYVDTNNPDSTYSGASRSDSKKAIVRIRSAYSSKQDGAILSFERIYSYTPPVP